MAKTVKGKQARKENSKSKPQAVSESITSPATGATAQEKTGQQPVGSNGAPVGSPSPAVAAEMPKATFSLAALAAYLKSGAWVYPLLLVMFMAFMFYIRAVPSYASVFTSWDGGYVNVAQDDAVMQMRLVHNTLAHFPGRIMFDPFTHFPFGSVIHFGPLFTLLIAGASLVVGLGNPSTQLVDTVGAYTPVVMAVLCAIPVYFIGKKLFGRNAGIIAVATLALLPGQFLGRSILGFTDHHIAEVLFSVVTVAFLVYALDVAKKADLTLAKIRAKDKESLKAIGYAALAGVAFGSYLLIWPGALLFGFMLFVYFAVQSIIDHFRNESLDHTLIIAAILYLVPTVMVLPYSLQDLSLQLMYYSITQPLFLCFALLGIGVIYLASKVLRDNKAETWAFPAALGGIAVVGLLVAYVAMPQVFALTMAGFNVFVPRGGMLTVAEAMPTIYTIDANNNYTFTTDKLWTGFYWTIVISAVALVMLAFRSWKHNRPAELLFLVWNLVMLWATCSQVRFTYYFAANAALLTGYFVVAMFRAFDSGKYLESFRARVKNVADLQEFVGKRVVETSMFAVLAVVFLIIIIYPATSLSVPSNYPDEYTKPWLGGITMFYATYGGGPGMGHEWFSSLVWLRDNTPDPQGSPVQAGFNYADGTYARAFYPNGTWKGYPSSAYGVMSWWDYGHIITYVAKRIPNANPFQAGILENGGKDGSCRFFLATSEDDGYRNLQNLGSRYVAIDLEMAMGKFGAITVWAGEEMSSYYKGIAYNITAGYQIPLLEDSEKYERTMMSRLYYDDCDDMGHFRLVYESPGNYYMYTKLAYLDQYQPGVYNFVPYVDSVPSYDNYTQAYSLFNASRDSLLPISQGSLAQFIYDSRAPVKYVKIYEVVKGASLTGTAPAGSTVTASVDLGIGGRTFTYTRSAVADANGAYAMVVPYATDAMAGNGYTSDVRPLSQYSVRYGNTSVSVAVPEQAVMNGETIAVSK